MKIILFSLGTRGDMEPFLALAERLVARNHAVICAMPAQFETLVKEAGYPFSPLSRKFLELIEGDAAKGIMGRKGNALTRIGALIKLYKESMSMQKVLVKEQHDLIEQEKPDRIVFHGKCMYVFLWAMANPGKGTFLSPVPFMLQPVETHATLGMGSNWGPVLNRWTYSLSNFGLFKTLFNSTKAYHQDFSELELSPSSLKQWTLEEGKSVFALSPALFRRPKDWPVNARVLGYHGRTLDAQWEPDEALRAFLDKYKKILFVSFGSMTNTDPEAKTASIIKVLTKHKIPAILNTSWGGLQKQESIPDHIHIVEGIPYDQIFPKMYAVMHHGGSGTTHMALKSGCPSLIIPHIMDQFAWNDLIAAQGAGPKGMSIKKLTAERLEPALLKLWNHEPYKRRAKEMAHRMSQENFEEELIEFVLGE